MVAAGGQREERDRHQTGLRVQASRQAGWRVVAFEGELDLAEAGVAAEALEEALSASERGIVADLSALSFLGSTGVRVLLEARARAADAGRGFRLVQGRGPARRLIGLLGLEQGLDVVDTD